jgi:hypothetical protein
MKAKQKIKNPYELNYRLKGKLGNWGNWISGKGEFDEIKTVQSQIKTIRMAHRCPIEIEFKIDGSLLDYSGKEIGKTIVYETR